jgi:predicted nucleotidyltransferase
MESERPVPPELTVEAAVALRDALDAMSIPFVFIGATAVAAYGHIRTTFDVDALAVLEPSAFRAFLQKAAHHGVKPRIADAEAFAAQHRVLLLVHEPTGVTTDMALALLPFEHRVIERARVIELRGVPLRVPLAEDLIVMKATAHRLKDLDDINELIALNPNLDRKHVLDELRPFADALDSPNLVEEIERMLQRGGRTQTG